MKTPKTNSLSLRAFYVVSAILVLLTPGFAFAQDENASGLSQLANSSNVLFILIGAVMILAMHGGFAFLEVGSVRKKNQVNALNKILCEWSFSTLI